MDWPGARVQLSSKAFGGSGTFEDALALLGFAISVPMFVTWIPETLGAILLLLGMMSQREWLQMTEQPGFWQLFASAYLVLAAAWYLRLVPIAVAAAGRV